MLDLSLNLNTAGACGGAREPMPRGWVEPDDLEGVTYENDYGVKFYSDGETVYPMMIDDGSTLAGWRTGLATVDFEGDDYVSVSVARVLDPTKQGVAPTILYVHNITGLDANNGLTEGAAKKTVEAAVTVANADADTAKVWEIRVATSTFIGGNSAGWTGGVLEIGANKKIKIIGVNLPNGSKPWRMPSVRNSYVKATFAWQNMGNGIWKTAAAGISANAKNTKIVFDLSVIDANGMPTPSLWLAGPFADEAAILAAMTGPSFHATATPVLYVKLASGAEPDPGVNYGYEEGSVTNRLEIEEGGRLMIENFRALHNAGTASTSILFFARPNTFTQGAASPNVVHDNAVVFKDCEIYGSSGNGFGVQSIHRFVVEGCVDGYCWHDGVNTHTLYNYPANSNSINEGNSQHTFVDGHLSLYHGENNFRGQPAVNASSNTVTDHSRGRTTVINTRGEYSNGSSLAIVGGAKCLAINSEFSRSKVVTPATDTYQANYLASGQAAGAAADGSEIWALYCSGIITGGVQFYGAGNAKLVAHRFKSAVTKLLENAATLKDGGGDDL